MPGAKRLHGFSRVQQPARYYLGGQTLSAPANAALTVPSEAEIITIAAETADCYFGINTAIAGLLSEGFVAQDTVQTVGPVANLTSARVHAPGAVVHVMYWREA